MLDIPFEDLSPNPRTPRQLSRRSLGEEESDAIREAIWRRAQVSGPALIEALLVAEGAKEEVEAQDKLKNNE